MANRLAWLKVISRLCVLAVLSTALIYLSADQSVQADSGTTCIQCDQNNVNGLSNCSVSRSSCITAANTQYNTCMSGTNTLFCGNIQINALTACDNTFNNCVNSTWNGYDNCLYGFTTFSGLCSIVSMPGYPPPSGKGRTPCDFACRDDMLECRQNGGDDCGLVYNQCKLSCG